MVVDPWFYISLGLLAILVACIRYTVMVGAYHLVVYKIFKTRLKKFKIKEEFPAKKVVLEEAKWALLNKVNFGFVGIGTYILYQKGYLKVYHDLDEYSFNRAVPAAPSRLSRE